MKRLEIIGNRSIEDDLFERLERRKAGRSFTRIPVVHGTGNSGPRQGDHVWPEENFMLIIYCGDEEALAIREAVTEVKAHFETEGLRIFELEWSGEGE